MNAVRKTYAVTLTIPDNEAFTAQETLVRMGLPVGSVRRATIWTFEVDPDAVERLPAFIASTETIFNPNKHAWSERCGAHPLPGEVWIAPRDEGPGVAAGGRAIAGVKRIDRLTAWQLLDEAGTLVDPSILDRAVETFLCNPAFQKAIR